MADLVDDGLRGMVEHSQALLLSSGGLSLLERDDQIDQGAVVTRRPRCAAAIARLIANSGLPTPRGPSSTTFSLRIDECCGYDIIAQDFAPLLKVLVGGQDGRGLLVAAAHQLEEQYGAHVVDWQVADFIDDEQRRMREYSQALS